MATTVSGTSGVNTQQVWHYVDATTTYQYAYWGDYTTAYAQIGGYYDSATAGHLEFYTRTGGAMVEQLRVPATGGLQFNGSTSGSSTIVPAAIAGSYTWTLINPGVNVNIGFLEVPQVSKTTSYTTVLTDSGKHIYANGTSITITIDANATVPYPIGTVLTFVNINSTSLTIAIGGTDTLYLAGAGTTGNRALAQYGMATALKLTSTTWLISGTGLT